MLDQNKTTPQMLEDYSAKVKRYAEEDDAALAELAKRIEDVSGTRKEIKKIRKALRWELFKMRARPFAFLAPMVVYIVARVIVEIIR
jgi:hypothetical protein